MASYNTRSNDPLLDSNLQAMLQKRGRELVGLGLIVLAGVFALLLGSYSPADPSWLSSSDVAFENSLGRFGAMIASPLMIIIGVASWGMVLFLGGWGLRLITGVGHNQVFARGIFFPIALAVTAVWCASLVPTAGWDTLYGMGGVFGDTVLGAIINALPMSASAGVKLMGVLMLLATAAIWAFVLGVQRHEATRFMRFVIAGAVLFYAGILALLRSGVSGGATGVRAAGGAMARKLQDRYAAHGARAAHEASAHHGTAEGAYPNPQMRPAHVAGQQEPGLLRTEPVLNAGMPRRAPPVIRAAAHPPQDHALLDEDDHDYSYAHQNSAHHPAHMRAMPEMPPHPAPASHAPEEAPSGLLARLKSLSNRPQPAASEPAEPALPIRGELVEPRLSAAAIDARPSGDARIKTRIADAIRHRKGAKPVFQFDRTRHPVSEPPLRAPAAPAHAQPMAAPQATMPNAPAASLSASLDAAPYGAVPMPDWMVAAQPEAPSPAPQPVAAPKLHAEPLFEQDSPRKAHVLQRRVVANQPARSQPSRQAQAEAEPTFAFEPAAPVFELPPLSLLEHPSEVKRYTLSDEALEENARMLENVLDDYGVRGEIVSVRPGPVVTQYELEPAPGLKASRVIGLADDIARSMSALSARVSTVPGRSIIGIELPNVQREKVVLREILAARDFGDSQMRLPLALGKSIDGESVVANLAKMPHLLIAGTTGSGKSVAINTMILSLLYRLSPEECRMIMIDPKMLELSVYDGIPHLLSPVVTDPKKAVVALKWVVGEMEERYRKMSKMGVRNIDGYNGRVREALDKGEMFKRTIQTGFDDETGDPVFESEEFAPELLPYIVVVVDEMADLMMVAGKEIEACIQRLAQMARASGIHLIMATQRPSVDVITGTIKANFPTRISFQVTSKIDSRTILGEQGAEQLLGMGDMLYMAGGSRIVRVHGPFVSDEEVEEVVNHLKSFGPPDYKSGVVDGPESDKEADIDAVLGLGGNTTGEDALYDQAVQVVIQDRKCSTSYIQRKLGIGYNKAARLVEQMEDEGLVTPANHVGKRDILVPEQG
ncbi:DNA translocase FtsK [Roseinatronobacter bogoriensis]|uniref:DNA translocase FtsK n=1 Tax=Roseinatronobacter bogoriensis subsp. barguzinensis TaxID=441209 RepID=A0A2K8K746_9RHOB|nr:MULTISPECIES: DNA translocase FtsK [Rhodobaca]ATX64736.1 DNA translocase FtsK [Rhodobaca barguzinensis]MBB4208515.1 S-DNA-T family DNA segregation ATPase FtsK/SpoIIIE [Rhodobaca bogoriensis DSM 18756]TDW38216.1 S-DNA-T family DNA segregation ATPase FtsK/SpoIIIE [Rhodobaca barguzinensis]TDY69613.1 DNA translocase FtsK [Rhodobaca bogoriensis DSM 18756]